MKPWKIAALAALAMLLVVAGGYALIYSLAERNFHETGSRQLIELLEGGLAGAVVVPAQQQVNVKQSAQLFMTYMNAVRVGAAAVRIPRIALPETSEGLAALAPGQRTDAWGHPFCLLAVDDRIAIISAGPKANPFPGCRSIGVTDRDIAGLRPFPMTQFPSGALVLVIESTTLRSPRETQD